MISYEQDQALALSISDGVKIEPEWGGEKFSEQKFSQTPRGWNVTSGSMSVGELGGGGYLKALQILSGKVRKVRFNNVPCI